MKTEQQFLWQQIEAFEFDASGTRLTFGQRLARENDWSEAYTRSVLLEYKRYVFLAMTAGHPVCPSDAVDQAWHMHLTYTRSYWDDFCGGVLGRPLHHGPTRGGRDEDLKHHDMYAKTLTAYRAVFGENAPADVWHAAEVRFGEDVAFSRVNTRRNWVIAKPRWLRKAALILGGAFAVSVAGCFSPMASVPVFAAAEFVFIPFIMLFSGVVIYFALKLGSNGGGGGRGGRGGCGGGCGGAAGGGGNNIGANNTQGDQSGSDCGGTSSGGDCGGSTSGCSSGASSGCSGGGGSSGCGGGGGGGCGDGGGS